MAITVVTQPGAGGFWSASYPLVIELSSTLTAQSQHRFRLQIYVDGTLRVDKWTVATDSNVATFDISRAIRESIQLSKLAIGAVDIPTITDSKLGYGGPYSPGIILVCEETYWNGSAYVTVAGPSMAGWNAFRGWSPSTSTPKTFNGANWSDYFGGSDTEPILFSGYRRITYSIPLMKTGWVTPATNAWLHIRMQTNNGGDKWFTPVDRQGYDYENMLCYIPLFYTGFTDQSDFTHITLTIVSNNVYGSTVGTTEQTIQIDRTIFSQDCPDDESIIMFKDRFGSWSYLTFTKKYYESITVEAPGFQNVETGMEKYNTQGVERLRLNTDFIDEKYNEQFKDLLLSPVCFLVDSTGALTQYTVSNNALTFKTQRNNRLVQYEIAFDKSEKVFTA